MTEETTGAVVKMSQVTALLDSGALDSLRENFSQLPVPLRHDGSGNQV